MEFKAMETVITILLAFISIGVTLVGIVVKGQSNKIDDLISFISAQKEINEKRSEQIDDVHVRITYLENDVKITKDHINKVELDLEKLKAQHDQNHK